MVAAGASGGAREVEAGEWVGGVLGSLITPRKM